MRFDVWIGPVIVAAAIAGLVNVLGWFVTGWRDRQADDRRRIEKQTDLSTALLAEVTHYCDALAFDDLDDVWAEVVNRMEKDETYMPFVPSERNDTIFRAIVSDLHILPETVIMPVARYYNQVFAIDAIIADLRSDAIRKEDQEKRISVYTDYISLKKQALEYGNAAISALGQRRSVARAGSGAAQGGGR